MNIQLCSFGCYLNSYKRISKLSNKELLTWTYKLVICTELFHESSLPKQNLNCSHTCGRIRSSTLNATCDPNIDLQFATASSLVKLGNRNLLCSEAMLSLKEIKMAGSLLVQTEPLLLSNILIGSSVLTLERGHWERGFLRDDVRAFRERGLRVSRVSPLCGSRAITSFLREDKCFLCFVTGLTEMMPLKTYTDEPWNFETFFRRCKVYWKM